MRTEQKLQTELLHVIVARQSVQTELLRVIVERQNVPVDEDLDELPDEVDLPLRSVGQINNMERLLSGRNVQRFLFSAQVHTCVRTHKRCLLLINYKFNDYSRPHLGPDNNRVGSKLSASWKSQF